MTLALLLTAVTGAWATETPIATILASENSTFVSGSKTFADKVKITFSGAVDWVNNRWQVVYDSTNGNEGTVTVEGVNGTNISKVVFYDEYGSHVMTTSPYTMYFYQAPEMSDFNVCTGANGVGVTDLSMITKIEVFGTADAPTVAWNASTKTGTFAMPGSDVVLTPIYAKAATFATTGTEPEVKTLLPEAAEGVIAGTDASLIAEGTGIVAFAGTSTEVTQGTLMYAVGNSATEAPALTAFSATVPTAKNVADDGANVYVWYYIQGADAPTNVAATLDNTFDDTEPACLTVQVLSNKFDVTLNAANANTIEAGKATVTVAGAAATVTDGKLQGVKMGSEVKLEAKPGYKFRKVEVKKAAESLITNPVVGQVIGSDGKNYAYGSLPTGVTAVAKICYVSGSNGLALALTDEEGTMNWSTALTTCAAHTPAITGGTWKLATKDEWDNMITAAGSHTALRNGFSSVGGTNMKEDYPYWSSTEDGSDNVWIYSFSYGIWSKNNSPVGYVRACLAF